MKNNLFVKALKASALVMFSLSLAVPANITTIDVYADAPALIQKYDFEKGFRGLSDTDENYKIIDSEALYIKKVGDQIEPGKDTTDANGLWYTGNTGDLKYYKQSTGNQPGTKVDEERGTVYYLSDTYDLPELVKELPAGIEGDETGSLGLDTEIPVGTVVREAGTYKSAITLTNPLSKLTTDAAVISFWGKVPAESTEEKIAFIEFSSDDTAVSFAYDAAVDRGTWHYYTYVVEKTAVTAYIDGAASTITPVVDKTAPEDYIAFLKTANFYLGATNASTVRTVEETLMDNVSFYDGIMSADDVKLLYDAEYTEANRKADIANPLALYTMDSTDQFTDINPEKASVIETFNINGHAVNGVAVVENAKGAEMAGIKIANPFAGKSIEGATVGYWICVEPKEGKSTIANTVSLAFIDEYKTIIDPKHGDEAVEAYSYLYTKTDMETQFSEGSHFGQVLEHVVDNKFTIMCADNDAKQQYVSESAEWHYITLTFNNSEITIYRDGKKLDLPINQSARFLDGYYRRVAQRSEPYTLYGAFGGSGNQRATMMMSFLSYEDTSMYFGWKPVSAYRNETTSPMNIARISCYDIEMSEEEVKALYDQEIGTINSMPEYVSYTLGDINEDGSVTAPDALIVLKISAKMIEATEKDLEIGDISGDGKLDATDALKILRVAAKLD